MNDEQRIPDPMILPVRSLHFPEISRTSHHGSYSCAFPYEDVPEGSLLYACLAEQIERAQQNQWGYVNLRSARPVRLYAEEGIEALIRFRQQADAMNIPFDSLLIKQPAKLGVSFWQKTRGANRGEINAALLSITISVEGIKFPDPLDPFYG